MRSEIYIHTENVAEVIWHYRHVLYGAQFL